MVLKFVYGRKKVVLGKYSVKINTFSNSLGDKLFLFKRRNSLMLNISRPDLCLDFDANVRYLSCFVK